MRHPFSKSYFRTLVILTGILAVWPLYAQSRGQVLGQGTSPANPKATAVVLNALNRFARGDANKSDWDRRVNEAMKRIPGSREAAAKILARFTALPAETRKKLFGPSGAPSSGEVSAEQFASVLRQLGGRTASETTTFTREPEEPAIDFDKLERKHRQEESDAPSSDRLENKLRRDLLRSGKLFSFLTLDPMLSTSLIMVLPQEEIVLEFTGIYCREECDVDQGTSSDELYIVTSVIDSNAIRTEKHPSNANYYRRMDTGDTRNGAVAACWNGGSENLCLVTTVFEQDSGDDRSWQDYKTTQDVLVQFAVLGQIFGGPAPCESAPDLIELLLDPVEDIPGVDDYIASVGTTLSDDDITSHANAAEAETRGGVPYDFLTYHRGDGARIRVFFRVHD